VVECSRALDVRINEWCEFKSRRGKNRNSTAQKSNANTVWFNFQTRTAKYSFKVLLNTTAGISVLMRSPVKP
jgi:tRNA(Ile2) C34 agmatinyltransferase TiaS